MAADSLAAALDPVDTCRAADADLVTGSVIRNPLLLDDPGLAGIDDAMPTAHRAVVRAVRGLLAAGRPVTRDAVLALAGDDRVVTGEVMIRVDAISGGESYPHHSVVAAAGRLRRSHAASGLREAAATIAARPAEAPLIERDLALLDEARAAVTAACDPVAPAEWPTPEPLDGPEPPPYPVGAMPSWLSEYAQALATETQSPVDLAASVGLAIAAGGCSGRVAVCVREKWIEPTCLYSLVALAPGERKSPVLARLLKPVFAVEADLVRAAGPAVQEAQARRGALIGRQKKLTEKAAKTDNAFERDSLTREIVAAGAELAACPEVVLPRLVAEDATPEMLAVLLSRHEERMLIASAEAGLLGALTGRRYSDTGGNLDLLLKSWSGDPVRQDRLSRESVALHAPHLTLALAIQPSALHEMLCDKEFAGRGFLARFLLAVPMAAVGSRTHRADSVPAPIEAEYQRRMRALWDLAPAAVDSATGEVHPHVLAMSPNASEARIQHADALEPRLHPEYGDLATVAEVGSKLSGQIARIAAVLALADRAGSPGLPEVTEGHMRRAIEIGGYHLAHVVHAAGLAGVNPSLVLARRILAWIRRTGQTTVTTRDAYQALGAPGPDDVAPGLAVLVDRGWIRAAPSVARVGAGRPPSTAWLVSPSVTRYEEIGP